MHGMDLRPGRLATVIFQSRISRNAILCQGFPLIDVVGGTGAMLTTLCWLPQALKVIREKETRALSLPATGAFTAGVVLWLVYG